MHADNLEYKYGNHWRKTASAEEIRAAIQMELRQLFLDDPALVAEAADQLGGRIIWPEQVQTASA